MSEPLDSIGLRYGTDKSSVYHDYLRRLEPYLEKLPRPMRFLEIGVLHGRSIRMWLDYLPDSHIFGIDLYHQHSIDDPRFTFYQGDATHSSLWASLGDFHIVIDDGNHDREQVIAAYDLGFHHVVPGGIWVIEDTCRMNYHVFDIMRPTVNELQDYDRDWCGNPMSGSSKFAFLHFLKGLIIIGKRT